MVLYSDVMSFSNTIQMLFPLYRITITFDIPSLHCMQRLHGKYCMLNIVFIWTCCQCGYSNLKHVMRVMCETLTLLPPIYVSAYKWNKYIYIMKKIYSVTF